MPDLIGLTLTLCPTQSFVVASQYTIELHSWFLDQVRRMDADLSAYMHDGQSEKPFTISGLLDGELLHQPDRKLLVQADQSYHWVVTALSANVADWMQNWTPPPEMRLKSGTLTIERCAIAPPMTTYEDLWMQAGEQMGKNRSHSLCFTFLSPTGFRQHGNHLPLPIPASVFQSYLRRWNHFVELEFDPFEFKQWVEEHIVILRHQIQSSKVQAGKQGSVTGFTGSVQFGLTSKAKAHSDYVQLVHALEQLAPYCGTGHKTTFGLGQTRLGWLTDASAPMPIPAPIPSSSSIALPAPNSSKAVLKRRIAELAALFLSTKKRQGGDRARATSELWAVIVARREAGESLKAIAEDLDLSYDTVKKHMARATEKLREVEAVE